MAGAGVHASELVLVVLLLFVIGFGAVAQRVGVPYPIVLVIGGLAVSLVPGVPRPVLEPDVVFLVFLPPLLYAGAWNTSWREFSRNLVDIASLAVGLVAVTVAGVAVLAARILPGFDWRTGFVLGAVVSTTDAIAATSIARRMKLPRRVVDVLEGESLVNDATGLLALEFGVSLLPSGATPVVTQAALRFLYLVVAGVGIGLALGVAVAWFERRIDNGPIEIAISIVVPYGTYLLAETVRASGVLAVVAAGLFLSRRSARFFSPTVRLQAHAFWEALNFILNGLVFLLIGLQLPRVLAGIEDSGPLRLIALGAAFSGIVILLRLIAAFPAIGFAAFVRGRLLRHEMPAPPPRQVFVLGWTGMRGVIALAAALSLPNTVLGGARFAQRDEIVFITFCVILATLVVQGLSLPPVIRALALEGVAKSNCEEPDARRIILEAALSRLEELRAADADHADEMPMYEDLAQHYRQRLAAASVAGDGASARTNRHPRREVVRDLLRVERGTAIRLRDELRIGDDVLRQLEHEIDLSEARLGVRTK